MPALKLYKRTWKIADDDFVIPEIIEGILRILWMGIVLGSAIVSYIQFKECQIRKYLIAYISGVLASCILTTFITFATAYISAKGSLADDKPRKNIKYFLYARLPLLIFDLIWAVFGTILLFYPEERCDTALMTAAKVTVKGNWIMLALYVIFIILLSRPMTKKKKIAKHDKRKQWDNCLNKMFRCGAQQKAATAQGAISDVATLLGYYFADTDLAFTDVLAGLRLLNAAKRLERHPHEAHLAPPPGKPDWMNLSNAARFIRYAAGSYGWPHYTAAYGCSGLYRVYKVMKCPCHSPAGEKAVIQQDNCCYCNTAVLLEMTEAYGPELRYLTLHNAVYEVPFSVLLDHAVQSIVVVVRGSLTLEDWVTDLSVVGAEYTIPDGHGNIVQVKGHKGFFESGIYISKALRDLKIIDELFTEFPDYHLVVTGQSLGAGVAPPLSLILREWYPAVRCFAYSPPGCVIAETDTGYTLENICTVVVGDDLVSHMSIKSLQKVKYEIMKALSTCDLPKYKVLRCGYRTSVPKDPEGAVALAAQALNKHLEVNGSSKAAEEANVQLLPEGERSPVKASSDGVYPKLPQVDPSDDQPTKTTSSGTTSHESSPEHGQHNKTDSRDSLKKVMKQELKSQDLCLPGIIMYCFQQEDEGPWILSWEKPQNFHTIIISSKVIDHHFPFTVAKVLAEAEAQHKHQSTPV